MQKIRITLHSIVFGMNCEYLYRVDTHPFVIASTICVGALVIIEVFFE